MRDLQVGEVSRLLGVSKESVRRWVREKKLAGYFIGARLRIKPESLKEFAPEAFERLRQGKEGD
ncbi:helix-turn-helix domain-containing protein [Calidithermus chliarophilus]|uniref:helix-turn-helix domain-containing protein n=1 Tax=Calidithermus chliarophilus TaxID=52023 RepID=UPI0009FBBFFD|nr:helix-turn-helix domain-containing protein [Calidithermus chliarophilus]